MKLIIILFLSISLYADNFILKVGEFYNLKLSDKTVVLIYKNSDIKTKYVLNKKEALYFLKTLTLNSDSENSPIAFEIKSENQTLRCLRKTKNVIEFEKSNCAIKNAINDSSFLRKQRSKHYLKCSIG